MLDSFQKKNYNTKSTPVLYIIGMPIGNIDDISLRALKILKESDLLICESRKSASTYFKAWQIEFPRENHIEWNEHNSNDEIAGIIDCILKTRTCVLVSDAGMPVLADPGSSLVTAARESGIIVQVIPGPSAITCALTQAGLGGQGFRFAGFPPRKTPDRSKWIKNLVIRKNEPVVIFETAYRLRKFLLEISQYQNHKENYIYIGIELTSAKEKTWHIRISEIKSIMQQLPKGAPVIILHSE